MNRPALLLVLATCVMPIAPARAQDAPPWTGPSTVADGVLGDPELARGPDGSVVAVWASADRIAAAVLAPGARAFGAPFSVAAVEGAVDLEAAIGPDGRLTVAWRQGRRIAEQTSEDVTVRATVGRPGGPFAVPQVLDTPERHLPVALAAAPDGAAYVAYARRRPGTRSQYDFYVAARKPGAERFGPEVDVDGSSPRGISRDLSLAATAGRVTVAFLASTGVIVDVAPDGTVLGRTELPVAGFSSLAPRLAALADGSLVTTDPASRSGSSNGAPSDALRVRPPGGAFGPALPAGTGVTQLAGAGARLGVVGFAQDDDRRRVVAGVGPPDALATRTVTSAGEEGYETAIAGAPDGRVLVAATSIVRDAEGSPRFALRAALASARGGFSPTVALTAPAGADGGSPAVAALGAGVAVVARRSGDRLLAFRTRADGDGGDGGGGDRDRDDGAGAGAQPGASGTGCSGAPRPRLRRLAAGGVRIAFRDLGSRVRAGRAPVLALRVTRGARRVRRVELVRTPRVADGRAPYRLRVPAAVTARPGARVLRVRLVTRGGARATVTLRFRVQRCG